MEFDDYTRQMVAHLAATPDAYLLGARDFSGPFTRLGSEQESVKAVHFRGLLDIIWAAFGRL
jgi:hypothetical protein